MIGFGVLLRKELLEQVRTLRLVVVVIVFALLGILSPLTAKELPELMKALSSPTMPLPTLPPPTAADALDQLLKNVGQFGALTAILLAMGSVATDVERGTAAFVLSKPAGRGAFLAAKLAALLVDLGAATAAAAVLDYLYTAILFEAPPLGGFVAVNLLLLLSLAVFAALTFLCSTIVPSAPGAGGLGFLLLLATGAVAILPTVGPYMPESLTGPGRALALGQAADVPWGPIVANLGFVAAAALLAWAAFARREL